MQEKISITMPTEMLDRIRARVEDGSYTSASEVIRAAMRTWMREEDEYEERIAAIRASVHAAMEDPRPNISLDDYRAELDERLKRREAEPGWNDPQSK